MINKYSKWITVARIKDVDYIHYDNEIVAFNDNEKKVFYLGEKHNRKRSVIEYIENTYKFKYEGYRIELCYDINNLLK